MGQNREGMLMVGDSPNTDLLFAKNAGIDSVLDYTGVTAPEDLSKAVAQPTYTLPRLGTFKEN